MSGVSECSQLLSAFINKKINLSSSNFPIALNLLIKLQGVRSLDLSYNNLEDISELQIRYKNGPQIVTVINGDWDRAETPLRELFLQGNKIKDAGVATFFRKLEILDLSDNSIENFESNKDIPIVNPGLTDLRVLKLANNPLKIPSNDTSMIRTSETYNFLLHLNSLNYLDISNTNLQTIDFTLNLNKLSYLISDNLKITETQNVNGLPFTQLQYLSLQKSTGIKHEYFNTAKNLVFADFSGSDLATLNNFTKPNNFNPPIDWTKYNLAFLFVANTKLSSFDAIVNAPNLQYFGAMSSEFNTEINSPTLALADYRFSSLTDFSLAEQTATTNCNDREKCIQAPSTMDSLELVAAKFFCKTPLNASGICENPHQTCDGNTVSYKHSSGPNSVITEICCTVNENEEPSLPYLGSIPTTVRDGKRKICASLGPGIFN
ncbi:MAG: hypothetical protein NTX25_24045 [Proteobacteria bacterium]|nr:hypothetical protein [Pseudomonadota bacterium]